MNAHAALLAHLADSQKRYSPASVEGLLFARAERLALEAAPPALPEPDGINDPCPLTIEQAADRLMRGYSSGRDDGRGDGIEEAARWHDAKEAECRAHAATMASRSRVGFVGGMILSTIERQADHHHQAAKAIRAIPPPAVPPVLVCDACGEDNLTRGMLCDSCEHFHDDPPAPIGGGWSKAAADVLAERARQVNAEGWTPEHDDTHAGGELGQAAVAYAGHAMDLPHTVRWWPWSWEGWKPTTPRRDLVKATALMLAEIERQDRAAALRDATTPEGQTDA